MSCPLCRLDMYLFITPVTFISSAGIKIITLVLLKLFNFILTDYRYPYLIHILDFKILAALKKNYDPFN